MINKMPQKFMPKIRCPRCSKEQTDYDDDKTTVTCAFYKCRAEINKTPHILTGGILSKNNKGLFVLDFPDMGEQDTFSTWEELQAELDTLHANEDKLKAEGIDLSYYTTPKDKGVFG